MNEDIFKKLFFSSNFEDRQIARHLLLINYPQLLEKIKKNGEDYYWDNIDFSWRLDICDFNQITNIYLGDGICAFYFQDPKTYL